MLDASMLLIAETFSLNDPGKSLKNQMFAPLRRKRLLKYGG